ncbi:MAG: cupin domain-containing protein [Holophaga sp.]|jgi:uncharacterized cupin superfamily protein
MAPVPSPVSTLSNATLAEFGRPAQWRDLHCQHPRLGEVAGKLFIGRTLGLSGMEVSLNALAPGGAVPFLHAHKQNEELYLFLDGEGEFQVDGRIIPVRAGSALRVAPAGMRGWRNTGAAPLTFLCIQAKAGSLEQATGGDGILGEQAPVWA